MEVTIQYTQNFTSAWMILRLIPLYIRPLVALFLPPVWTLKHFRRVTVAKLAPILAATRRGGLDADGTGGGEIAGGVMLDWLMSHYQKPPSAE